MANNHLTLTLFSKMYALCPTLFKLLTVHLDPRNWLIADNAPNMQYALLNTLYTGSNTSTLFRTRPCSSNAASRNSCSPTPRPATISRRSSRSSSRIGHVSCTYDTSLLVLDWLLEVVDMLLVDYALKADSKYKIDVKKEFLAGKRVLGHFGDLCNVWSSHLLR